MIPRKIGLTTVLGDFKVEQSNAKWVPHLCMMFTYSIWVSIPPNGHSFPISPFVGPIGCLGRKNRNPEVVLICRMVCKSVAIEYCAMAMVRFHPLDVSEIPNTVHMLVGNVEMLNSSC